jgi:hypothetical protein
MFIFVLDQMDALSGMLMLKYAQPLVEHLYFFLVILAELDADFFIAYQMGG